MERADQRVLVLCLRLTVHSLRLGPRLRDLGRCKYYLQQLCSTDLDNRKLALHTLSPPLQTFDTSCPALVTPSPTLSPTLSPTPAPVTDPIHIAAASFNNRASVRRGMSYALKVTLTMPALVGGRRLIAEDQRELQGANSAHTNKKPLNATDYALFVTVPRGGAVDMLTYRRTVVRPQLKPASLKKPQVQSNGDLLWSRVPMLRYMTKAYTRTFKVKKGVGMRRWHR